MEHSRRHKKANVTKKNREKTVLKKKKHIGNKYVQCKP